MATMPSVKDSIDQLNSFLRGEISAVETYDNAYENAKSESIRDELAQCRRSHERRVALLRDHILRLGGKPAEGSGVWGAFAKVTEGGAGVFGESATISALEEGEDHGLKDYKSDLSKLDAQSQSFVLSEILPEQEKTHRTLSTLKHSLH
jgi:uncharacterized protein (TIGR02284 family)